MNQELIDNFIACFPEFSECSPEEIIAVYKQIELIHNCFGSIKPENVRKHAVYLAMAHYLSLRFDAAKSGGQIKSIKNRNDTITYAVADTSNPYGWYSTIYGSQLMNIIKTRTIAGFVSQGGAFKCL